MNLILLSLIFVSPLMYYAGQLLSAEYRDPLLDYHDQFRKSEKSENPRRIRTASTNSAKVGIAVGFIFLTLVLSGAGSVGIISFLISVGVYFYWDRGKDKRIYQSRVQQLEMEFPAFVELFAILMVAGESPSLAFMRLSEISEGQLSQLVRDCVAQMKAGAGISSALENLARVSDSATIRRFCDSLIIALERGTSLADVLHRQVEDVRKAHQADLLKRAGKAEIALMVPVVFLILPISVLFALWPSYLALGQSMV